MKITVYTVSDCQFSKQEKEYLQSHNLPFEEKNLEQNREWLTEMLTVSNNFAGTPVTKIEKDDGTIVVLKGFTQEEFDEVLGFKEQVSQAPAQMNVPQTPPPPPPQPQVATQPPTNQPQKPPQPSEVSPSQSSPATPNNPANNPVGINQPDPLNSILADLQAKANQPPPQPPTQPPIPNQPPPTNLPNIPDFNDKI